MARKLGSVCGKCKECGFIGDMEVTTDKYPNGVAAASCPECGHIMEPREASMEERVAYERQQAPHLAAKYDELLEAVNDVVDELDERIGHCEDTASSSFTDAGRMAAYEGRGLEEARDLIENKVLEEHNNE